MFTNPHTAGIGSKSPGKAGREVLSDGAEQVLPPALGTNTEGLGIRQEFGRSWGGQARPGQPRREILGELYITSCPPFHYNPSTPSMGTAQNP